MNSYFQNNSNSEQERALSPELNKILYKQIPVLDHGFIRVIDYMGNDAAIVQAARVSYGIGTKQINQDKGLINYLLRNKHTSPFEMCEIKFHIKLPIFIARQWIRHRTANVNEYSARYSILDNEFYLPNEENLAEQSDFNKQGRNKKIEDHYAKEILDLFKSNSLNSYDKYKKLLNEEGAEDKPSLSRELARMCLPVNFYTQWYWKIDLHNLLHFVKLRSDTHAQYEIRVYAKEILEIIKKWVPLTYEAFMNYHIEGYNLSREALNVVRRLVKGEKPNSQDTKLSKREWNELIAQLGIEDESTDQQKISG